MLVSYAIACAAYDRTRATQVMGACIGVQASQLLQLPLLHEFRHVTTL